MAVSDRLEDALVARIDGLNLTLGAVSVSVERKKAPKVERGLESTPLIQVTAAERAVRYEWFDTGTEDTPNGRKKAFYPADIHMSAPGNRDPNTDEDTYRDWREAIMRAFEPPSVLDIDELYDVIVEPGPQYDRGGFPRNYDQSVIQLLCVTIEPAA